MKIEPESARKDYDDPTVQLINKGPRKIPSRISYGVRLYVNTQNPSKGTPRSLDMCGT